MEEMAFVTPRASISCVESSSYPCFAASDFPIATDSMYLAPVAGDPIENKMRGSTTSPDYPNGARKQALNNLQTVETLADSHFSQNMSLIDFGYLKHWRILDP